MRGKKARRLRKEYGVDHVRHAIKIERSGSNMEELKQRMKQRKANEKDDAARRTEAEALAVERGKALAPSKVDPANSKGVTRLK